MRMFKVFPVVGGMMTGCLVLACVGMIDLREGKHHRDNEIAAWLSNTGSMLETQLTAHLHVARSLRALVATGRDVSQEEFQAFTDSLLRDNPAILNISFQPDGIIKYVTRHEVADKLIGHNMFEDPDPVRRGAVLKAIRANQLWVSGPINLITNEEGVVGRLPIYLPAKNGDGERFWGLISVVIDARVLFRQVGLVQGAPGVEVAARGNARGYRNGLFFGSEDVFENEHRTHIVDLPNGRWMIAARPTTAWPASWPGRDILWLVGFALAVALGLLMFGLIRWPQRLRRGIYQATRELRRVNARLQASEAHFRSLYEKTPVMMHSLHRDGSIAHVSDHWLERLGYSLQEVIGRDIYDFQTPESAIQSRETGLPQLWRDGKISRAPATLRSKSGEIVEVEVSAIIDRSPDGVTSHTRTVMTDVTARNIAQRQLAQKNVELQSANDSLRQFALVASHDLQEPLRKIGIFTSMIEQDAGDTLPADCRQALNGLMAAARRLSRLVSDMLKYSRTGNAAYTMERTDLRAILDNVLGDLAIQIEEAGAEIEIGSLPVVQADPSQTAHLFQNLVSNALKYRFEGRPCRIQIGAEKADDTGRWTITFRDNGIGFDPAHAASIWQPFHRLHSQSEYAGSGIGLAICAKIAERHSWNLSAAGEPGSGATFNLEVPDAA